MGKKKRKIPLTVTSPQNKEPGTKKKKSKGNQKENERASQFLSSDVTTKSEELYSIVDCGEKFQKRENTPGQSITDAEAFFQWLIAPVSIEEFFDEYWEKKSLHVKRHRKDYYEGWFSMKEMDQVLRKRPLFYGKNLDITQYVDGQRKTLNPEVRRADAEEVGCSVRMLHPQQFSQTMWQMLAQLEEYWGCQGGCNSYLTPANSAGFAPHYDDVEAFVLQMEGSKNWRLFPSRAEEEILPRYSSPNFKEEELGEPFLETVVECGDLFYFPRGTIHQATCTEEHSLHCTVSTALRNSWADYLEMAVPRAIQIAFDENVEMRTSLPNNYFEYMGAMYSDRTGDVRRQKFAETCSQMMELVIKYLPSDAAADQMAINFIQRRLPPFLPNSKPGGIKGLNTQSVVKMVSQSAARLVVEDEAACVYSPMQNQREYHAAAEDRPQEEEEEPEIGMEFELELAPALEYIITSWPNTVTVDAIPVDSDKQKLEIVTRMIEYGVLEIVNSA